MNENDREKAILEYLKTKTFASVKDLKTVLRASDATIRRDISKLDEKGALLKVFGGIAPRAEVVSDRHAKSFSETQVLNVEQKRTIAKAAIGLCEDGDSIIVNGGSTAYMFARELKDRSLNVFTNSLPVAAFLWEHSSCRLVVAGGEFYREPGILYGGLEHNPKFFASKFFLGTQAFGPEGIMESNPLLVEAIGGLMEMADEIIVLCDASKFDLRARMVACPIERVSTVITDSAIQPDTMNMLEVQGIKVILADMV